MEQEEKTHKESKDKDQKAVRDACERELRGLRDVSQQQMAQEQTRLLGVIQQLDRQTASQQVDVFTHRLRTPYGTLSLPPPTLVPSHTSSPRTLSPSPSPTLSHLPSRPLPLHTLSSQQREVVGMKYLQQELMRAFSACFDAITGT